MLLASLRWPFRPANRPRGATRLRIGRRCENWRVLPPAPPAPVPGPAARRSGRGPGWLVWIGCWGPPQAAACGLGVVLASLPAPTPDGSSPPAWVYIAAIPVGFALPAAVLLMVPLAVAGFRQVRLTGRWRWHAAWGGAVAAAIALETTLAAT